MGPEKIRLKSVELIKDFLKMVKGPVPLDILEMTYDKDTDLFLTRIDIGILDFVTALNLDHLEQLVEGMREMKDTVDVPTKNNININKEEERED